VSIEAMKKARLVLYTAISHHIDDVKQHEREKLAFEAISDAIKDAEKQEPVARVGLTDTEIATISGSVWENNLWDENTFARAIEAKLKEKNGI